MEAETSAESESVHAKLEATCEQLISAARPEIYGLNFFAKPDGSFYALAHSTDNGWLCYLDRDNQRAGGWRLLAMPIRQGFIINDDPDAEVEMELKPC